jgi:hypothetical protein
MVKPTLEFALDTKLQKKIFKILANQCAQTCADEDRPLWHERSMELDNDMRQLDIDINQLESLISKAHAVIVRAQGRSRDHQRSSFESDYDNDSLSSSISSS